MSNNNSDPLRDPTYKGEKTPKHLTDGPVNDRNCTDFLCLLIFGAFWAGFVYIFLYSWKTGNPSNIITTYDYLGNGPCGQGSAQNYEFLYWNIDVDTITGLCVKSCPTSNDDAIQIQDMSWENYLVSDFSTFYNTTLFAGKLCIPNNLSLYTQLENSEVFSTGFIATGAADVETTRWVILEVAVAALVFGFLYLTLMRYCAGVMVWTLIIFYFIGLTLLGVFLYPNSANLLSQWFGVNAEGYTYNGGSDPQLMKGLSYACFAVVILSFLALFCLFNKIRLAIAVLKCAGIFIENTPQILIIPPLFFVFSIIFFLGWSVAAVYAVGLSSNTPAPNFGTLNWDHGSKPFTWYNGFALLWGLEFFSCLSQFVVASACCMWYFCQADNKTPDSPVSRSFVRGGFWHIGSIAFAAFVVAVVEMIRIIIAYFEARMRSVTQGNNAANWLVGCVDCCLACFERFIRFISRHAFVQIAMRSEGFCKAAQESFFLMLRYAAQFGLVHGIGSLFASIGNIFITALATFFGYYIVMHDYSGQVYSWIVPCVVFLFVSYIIAHVFMNVYGVSADAIVHCYCMDEEIHDTVKHAPPLLREFVDTHAPKQ